ncbi:hypothetical protein B5S27_g2 [[Candida] boidinii]|nr:hypothetical protein B5S27_g2 [[Candida] boidinii]
MFQRDAKIDAAVHSGDYQLAQSLVVKKIKQYPNTSYYYAIESKIAQLMGDYDASLKKATDLFNKTPSDPDAVVVLSDVFTNLEYYLPDDETVFERCSKKYPTFPLINKWFNTMIESNDVIGMQKSTMMLNKIASSGSVKISNSKLLKFWSATTLMLCCLINKQKLKPSTLKLYPMLGLKLIESFEAEFDNYSEFYVFAKLLILSNKSKEACIKIENFLKNKENNLTLKILLLETLNDIEDYEKLNELSRYFLIDLKEDDWDIFKLLIKSQFKLNKTVDELVEIINNYKFGRNKYLAYLEIFKIYKYDESKFIEYFSLYLENFGHKLCCFPDLKIFLKDDLSGSLISLIENSIENKFNEREIDSILKKEKKSTENDLIFMVNYIKFKMFLNKENFTDLNFINKCITFYNINKHLLKNKEVTEYYPGFEFIILLVQSLILINKNKITNDSVEFEKLVVKLIIILEMAVANDLHEFHLRLWLIKLYNLINCYSESKFNFEFLKIKLIQLDTLSNSITNRIGTTTTDKSILNSCTNFYDSHAANDCPNLINYAFQNGTFDKLQGFIELSNRLSNSLTNVLNAIELIKISRITNDKELIDDSCIPVLKSYWGKILNNPNYLQGVTDLDCKISDNRDIKTFWDNGIHEKINEIDEFLNSNISNNPTNNINYVKLNLIKELILYKKSRNLPTLINQYNELVNKQSKEEDEENFKQFTSIELWSFKTFQIIINKNENENEVVENAINEFTKIFNDSSINKLDNYQLDWKFNHFYYSTIDNLKILKAYVKNYSNKLNKDKLKSKSIRKLINHLEQIIKKFKDDNLMDLKKIKDAHIRDLKSDISDWFINDETIGKNINISEDFINGCFNNITSSTDESLKNLRNI